MKKLILLFALATCAVSAFANLTKAELEATHAKVCAFLKNKDIDGFAKYMRPRVTADFKHVENGQTMTFDQMIAQMKAGMGMMGKITMVKVKLMDFKSTADTAGVTTRHTMAAETKGPDGKMHKMGFTGDSKDVFRKENGKWKMASMTWVKQTMTMDGKPFNPAQMTPPAKVAGK